MIHVHINIDRITVTLSVKKWQKTDLMWWWKHTAGTGNWMLLETTKCKFIKVILTIAWLLYNKRRWRIFVITPCTCQIVYKFHIKTVLTSGHTNRLPVTEPWFPFSGNDNTKIPTECKQEEALPNWHKNLTNQYSTVPITLNSKQILHVAYSIGYVYMPHEMSWQAASL